MHSVPELACQTLRRFSETIQKNLDGAAQGTAIESIHQVRVACRRLRTALRLFADCLDKGLADKWKKESKRLLKDLRKARDLDIQIQFLEELSEKKSAQNKKVLPGIKRLLLRLRQRRESLQKTVRKAVERFRKQNVLMEIRLETERLLWIQQSQPPAEVPPLMDAAGNAVRPALQKTRERLTCLRNRKDLQGHHQLRIAVKRLRYTLEIFQPALEENLEPFIKPLKKMQTLLGDLHDCVVRLETLEELEADEKDRTFEYFGYTRPFFRFRAGFDYVRRYSKKQQRTLFREVCDYCRELEQDGFWQAIDRRFASLIPQPSPENHASPQP